MTIDALHELTETDIEGARAEVRALVGELTTTPVSTNGVTGLELEGKPKLDGVLGIVMEGSTRNGSGEGI